MKSALGYFGRALSDIEAAGTLKGERVITTPQRARIDTTGAQGLLNLCANNYLGLADSPEVIRAAKDSYDRWGFGLSSVRFICGTQGLHKELAARLSAFLGMEDAILYSSCFDSNGGLVAALVGPESAIISDDQQNQPLI